MSYEEIKTFNQSDFKKRLIRSGYSPELATKITKDEEKERLRHLTKHNCNVLKVM